MASPLSVGQYKNQKERFMSFIETTAGGMLYAIPLAAEGGFVHAPLLIVERGIMLSLPSAGSKGSGIPGYRSGR